MLQNQQYKHRGAESVSHLALLIPLVNSFFHIWHPKTQQLLFHQGIQYLRRYHVSY